MSSVTYPIKTNNGKFRATVPILVMNPATGKKYITDALIDTGADNCCFPKHIAEFLDHNLKGPGVKQSISKGIGGKNVTTWLHTFVFALLSPDRKQALKWTTQKEIGCFDHEQAPILLGTTDFLKDYKLTIDYINKEVTLSW